MDEKDFPIRELAIGILQDIQREKLQDREEGIVYDDDDDEDDRPPIEIGIIQALIEVREILAGRQEAHTWDEFQPELEAMIAEVEGEEQEREQQERNRTADESLRG